MTKKELENFRAELVQGANGMLTLAGFVQSWTLSAQELDRQLGDAREYWQRWREKAAWEILALPGPEQEAMLAALPEPVRHPVRLKMACVGRLNQEAAVRLLDFPPATRQEILNDLTPTEKTIAERAFAVEAGLQNKGEGIE